LRKSVSPENFSEDSMSDPQIEAFMSKIKLTIMPNANLLSARLRIIMKDGRKFVESTDTPMGDPVNNPMSKDKIIEKFRANIEFSQTVTKENGDKLLGLLDKLESLDNVNRIIALLVPVF
jgi:2-methylcitrate dehydratase PrpD